jgi:hypothetical protein
VLEKSVCKKCLKNAIFYRLNGGVDGGQDKQEHKVDHDSVGEAPLGVDFMKPFWPKFTDETKFGQILSFVMMTLYGSKIP